MSVDTKGDYNVAEYNEVMYNDNDLFMLLTETITSTDGTVPKDDSILRTELLTLIDNLQKFFNGAVFNDMITASDVRLMQPMKSLVDSMTISDDRLITFLKSLPETVTLMDTIVFSQARSYQEFILLVDILTKQITNKQLPTESIRLNDWLEIRNNPQSDPWN